MEEQKGRVSRIYQNETKTKKPYWVLSVQADGGEQIRYSVWNWKTLEGIHEGDIITYKFEQKEGFNNITEITKTEKQGPKTDAELAYALGGRVEQIGRMSALKSATLLFSEYNGDPEEKLQKTLSAAKEFERYIFGVVGENKKNNDDDLPI